MHELSLSMPEPMLSLSMLILATYPSANSQHVLECSEHRSARSEHSECAEKLSYGLAWLTARKKLSHHATMSEAKLLL